jgi:hypothetical protein
MVHGRLYVWQPAALQGAGGRKGGPSAGEMKQRRLTFDGGRLHRYPRNENQQNLGKNERQ